MSRHGLLGGTFDPIHEGHLDVARAARRALALDDVVLMPARVPPHRTQTGASAEDRVAMARLAVQDEPGLSVSDLEMHGAGPSYTFTTLDRLEASGVDLRTLFFIIGADAFLDIASWRHYPAVLDRCHFAVASRPRCPATSMPARLPALAGRMIAAPCVIPSQPSIVLIDAPTADVSSTDIRRRLAEGLSIDGLVPPAVSAYIETHGPYRVSGTGERTRV